MKVKLYNMSILFRYISIISGHGTLDSKESYMFAYVQQNARLNTRNSWVMYFCKTF